MSLEVTNARSYTPALSLPSCTLSICCRHGAPSAWKRRGMQDSAVEMCSSSRTLSPRPGSTINKPCKPSQVIPPGDLAPFMTLPALYTSTLSCRANGRLDGKPFVTMRCCSKYEVCGCYQAAFRSSYTAASWAPASSLLLPPHFLLSFFLSQTHAEDQNYHFLFPSSQNYRTNKYSTHTLWLLYLMPIYRTPTMCQALR